MKTKLIALTALAAVMLSSCKKEEPVSPVGMSGTTSSYQTRNHTKTIHEQAGEYHNAYLNKFYDDMAAKMDQIGHNAFQLTHIKQTHNDVILFELLNELNVTGNSAAHLRNYHRNKFDQLLSFENRDDAMELHLFTINNSSFGSASFKSEMVSMLNEIDEIGKRGLSTESVSAFVEVKTSRFTNLFEGQELDIALIGLQTLKYSFEYWSENVEKWHILASNGQFEEGGDIIVPVNYLKADVGGAITGGMIGAIGGGGGAVPGAVVGGLGASVYEIVMDILTYFGW